MFDVLHHRFDIQDVVDWCSWWSVLTESVTAWAPQSGSSPEMSQWSGRILGSTLILISRWKHMWPDLPGPIYSCFVSLRRLRSIRRSIGRDVTARPVSALMICTTGYCNSMRTHLPASTFAPPQRVLNAAVRLVHDFGTTWYWDTGDVWTSLHGLPIAERIKFKLCNLLVYHAVNGRAPSYLTELVTPVANIPGRASLRSAGGTLVVPCSILVSSEWAFSVAAPRANVQPAACWH